MSRNEVHFSPGRKRREESRAQGRREQASFLLTLAAPIALSLLLALLLFTLAADA